MEKILVTGAAGFIGFHVSQELLNRGHAITGIDNLNDYYDVELKCARLAKLKNRGNFRFVKGGIENREMVEHIFREGAFDAAINLAAQPGVRYSLKNPYSYIDSNIVGFTNILEGCRHNRIKHLVFASSSLEYTLTDDPHSKPSFLALAICWRSF